MLKANTTLCPWDFKQSESGKRKKYDCDPGQFELLQTEGVTSKAKVKKNCKTCSTKLTLEVSNIVIDEKCLHIVLLYVCECKYSSSVKLKPPADQMPFSL